MKPLRILIVNGKMICGGVESFIMNIYRRIDRTKVQFDFLVHYKERFFYDDEIESLGGKIYRLSFRNDKNYFKYKHDLSRFFKEHKEYAAVWGHMDGLASIYLRVAKRCGVKTTIAHAHITNAESSLKGLIKRLLKKNISKYADIRFACSTEAGKYLYGKNQFKVVPNAIDTKKYRYDLSVREKIREKLNFENKYVIGHVGRFNLQKNHKYLIDVFSKTVQNCPDAVLCLCGDGEEKNNIISYVKKLGLYDKVYFAGNVSNINEFYQAFDIFVMPSLYEGLPISGVEAQNSGLPCVFSNAITKEVQLTKDVVFLAINEPEDTWSVQILQFKNYLRQDNSETVKNFGYDIWDEARAFEEFFIKNGNSKERHS